MTDTLNSDREYPRHDRNCPKTVSRDAPCQCEQDDRTLALSSSGMTDGSTVLSDAVRHVTTSPAGREAEASPAPIDDDIDRCIACNVAFEPGDLVLHEAGGGEIHVACCGPERESYTGVDGEPLKDGEPIPTGYPWQPAPSSDCPQGDGTDALDILLVRVASVICGAACGTYSHCLSREAAQALFDAGLLASATPPVAPTEPAEWHVRAEKAQAELARAREMIEPAPDCHGLDTPELVCFYEQDFYVLSNFSAFKVSWGPYTLDTSEQLYHWRRFFLAGHAAADKIADQIMRARSAHDAFKLAQANRHLQISTWDDIKVGEMKQILHAKAEQHEYVRRKLLATGDRALVENSWRDDFWGWGPNRDGKNMLGKLWMEVRAEIRAARDFMKGGGDAV